MLEKTPYANRFRCTLAPRPSSSPVRSDVVFATNMLRRSSEGRPFHLITKKILFSSCPRRCIQLVADASTSQRRSSKHPEYKKVFFVCFVCFVLFVAGAAKLATRPLKAWSLRHRVGACALVTRRARTGSRAGWRRHPRAQSARRPAPHRGARRCAGR